MIHMLRKLIKGQSASSCCAGTQCACDGPVQSQANASADTQDGNVSIVVLGTGCAKCQTLEATAREALASSRIAGTVTHVTDVSRIAAYGVMRTPALMVNGAVISQGLVPGVDEVRAVIVREVERS